MRSSRYALLAALVLVLVTNGVVLLDVYANRTGEPDAVVMMTERELQLPAQYDMTKENSGLSLHVKWRVQNEEVRFEKFSYEYSTSPAWLDRRKLAGLGFDTTADPTSEEGKRHYEKMLPRRAFLVLEYDGDAYRQQLGLVEQHLKEETALASANPGKEEFAKRVTQAQEVLDRERTVNSRLFIVDAGTDDDALRGRYPDRTRYLIVGGEVRLLVKPKGNTLTGMIDGLDMGIINVPLAVRRPLDSLMKSNSPNGWDGAPRYSVTLAMGRRLEPWIMDVRSINDK
jgi:hypothetical protein